MCNLIFQVTSGDCKASSEMEDPVLRTLHLLAALQEGSHQSGGAESPLWTCWPCCSGFRTCLALWVARARCRIMSSLSSTSTPEPSQQSWSQSVHPPACYWYRDLPWLRCSTWHLTLLNLMKFTWDVHGCSSGSAKVFPLLLYSQHKGEMNYCVVKYFLSV